jgi:predicted amidophosphoribosyltransferase
MELARPAEAGGVRPSVPYPRTTEALPLSAPTQGVQFCTQCGMRLGHAHRFCGFCGHPVEMP